MRLALMATLGLAVLPGCKRRSTEEVPAAPAPVAPAPTPAPSEGTFDALNPPPRDLAVKADTANGHPGGPKTADIDAAQAEAQRKVQACLDGLPAKAIPGGSVRLVVQYVLDKDGKAHDVSVEGATPEAMACGKTALEAASFPTFQGRPIANAFSLTYSRPQAPPDLAVK